MAATEEPKKAMTAYFLYLQANRDAVQKELGLGVKDFGPVTKELSARWKGLGAKEKASFEKQAADAKAEYEKAMEAFKAAGGVKGAKRKERKEEKDAKAAKKAKKEANAASGKPKQLAGGGCGRYLAHHRDEIQKSLPAGSKCTAVSKAAGEQWKALSANNKKKYEAEYNVMKAKYYKELAAWKEAAASGKPKKLAGGAYGRYLAHHRDEIQKSLPAGSKCTAVSKAAGEQWKALSANNKKKYEAEYNVMKAKYYKELAAWKEANAGDPSPEEAKTPPAKRPRAAASGKSDSTKKVRVTQGKSNSKAPPAAAAAVELERDIAEKAEKAGITAVLEKLLAREDVAASGKSQAEAFQALQAANGLVRPASRALLGA